MMTIALAYSKVSGIVGFERFEVTSRMLTSRNRTSEVYGCACAWKPEVGNTRNAAYQTPRLESLKTSDKPPEYLLDLEP